MLDFLYSVLLKLLYPTSMSLLLLAAAAVLRNRRLPSRICFGCAAAILLACGNGFFIGALTRHLEWQYLPPNPVPEADAIVVLSGGLRGRVAPRTTVELAETGERLLYGAYLYRHEKAPCIICTGNVATGGVAARPAAEEMAEFLQELGVPKQAIVTEINSQNTHQHAKNLYPMLQQLGFKHIRLVTSAMHMPRSLGTFRRLCPGITFTPAPTDFGATERIDAPWYHQLVGFIPTPRHLLSFSEVTHEYLGIAYYRMRGWM